MKITEKITITNEDNMELMARYPDGYFDLAIVDPPYGIGEHGGKIRHGDKSLKKGFKVSNKYTKKDWDKNPPTPDYFKELFRVSKNQIIWGGNYFLENLKNTPCFIVWDKKGNDKSDFADCEIAWTSFSTSIRKFKYDWIGFGNLNLEEKRNRFHPTHKPEALYKWLLNRYANPNDKILDTHLGSGSVAIACFDYGFELTACELDKDYYDSACKRIKHHIAFNQSLFQPEELTQTLF
ncbi:DNA methyltransferase [Elizabethkingia anophelis]|uniref:Methyltransferase n=1 Tax=Elizabethkingia anophelis TaxID=1117645 RepID=A0A7Z7LU11_9FLAO|nr:DNA methyltransferase [Elizabethkingia anophelis]EJC8061961.1 site-specific DNA-methyltransferase [Elizabethkingia anophelis]MCL1640051.1 site-specific DNA-methyltransferase [Elizabethkingia anophelis]MCL1646558.1 site-specific DNA-methyltransferase [Elizabethkingia anophelis]MDV3474591.1 DNA modification methylase [Elizabethkingia anophelis]MDV3551070.1 DNA modification methylase [Elizabethkingia anophelis]